MLKNKQSLLEKDESNQMQQQENKKIKKIKQVSVKNLFGMFNHTIPFHIDDRITIIHGPNGFGKTVILRLLYALFTRNNDLLRTTRFDEINIDFDDGTDLKVIKDYISYDASKLDEEKEKITFQTIGEQPLSLPSTSPLSSNQLRIPELATIEQSMPSLVRIAPEHWMDVSTNETFSFDDVLDKFGDRLPVELVRRYKKPEWLSEIRASIPIRLVETQRLLKPTTNTLPNTPPWQTPIMRSSLERQLDNAVTVYSEQLVNVIKTKLTEYAALSQLLDSTFPKRLVTPTAIQRGTSESTLRSKLAELENKRSRLMAAGLLNQDTDSTFQLEDEVNESTKVVLNVYVEDTEKKLRIFDELANKIDLLTKIINKRFLYKQMTIDREKGFVITTQDSTDLPYTSLSSGEQHELVLLYELLFKVAPGSLILIDEPEISLHVVWQKHFLTDLQEITRLANIDALVATHSPDIIHDRRDLVVWLEGPK